MATTDERPIEKVPFCDPFTGAVSKETVPVYKEFFPDYNQKPLLDVALDKETGNTKIVVSGYEDQDKSIQQRVNDCGFEGMRNLIKTGLARRQDFADDGQHSGDASIFPDNINDAYRESMRTSGETDAALSKIGVKAVYNKDGSYNQEATEQAIKLAVQNLLKAAQPREGETK